MIYYSKECFGFVIDRAVFASDSSFFQFLSAGGEKKPTNQIKSNRIKSNKKRQKDKKKKNKKKQETDG